MAGLEACSFNRLPGSAAGEKGGGNSTQLQVLAFRGKHAKRQRKEGKKGEFRTKDQVISMQYMWSITILEIQNVDTGLGNKFQV